MLVGSSGQSGRPVRPDEPVIPAPFFSVSPTSNLGTVCPATRRGATRHLPPQHRSAFPALAIPGPAACTNRPRGLVTLIERIGVAGGQCQRLSCLVGKYLDHRGPGGGLDGIAAECAH